MTARTELSGPKRRTRAEVQELVAQFMSSGMRRGEFCRSRGLSFSTLDRHLKKRRWRRRSRPVSSAGPVGKGGVGGQEIADATVRQPSDERTICHSLLTVYGACNSARAEWTGSAPTSILTSFRGNYLGGNPRKFRYGYRRAKRLRIAAILSLADGPL